MEDTKAGDPKNKIKPHRASLTHRSSPKTPRSIPSSPNNEIPHVTGTMTYETTSPSSQNFDIDVLLLEEDKKYRNEGEDDEEGVEHHAMDENNTVVSSLPPFRKGGVNRSHSDLSSLGSSVGYILNSNISIDDDLECGPVPDYNSPDKLTTHSNEIMNDSHKIGGSKGSSININTSRPNEVYINMTKGGGGGGVVGNEHNQNTHQTPGKLSAYMGISRRHKSSEASVGGSSIGSKNSLSSIFESIGYLKRHNRRSRHHHSRGLTKKREQGTICRLLTGSTEPKPTSFENESEEILYRKREERKEKLRLSILLMVLATILICINELSSVDDGGSKYLRKDILEMGNGNNSTKTSL